MCVWEQPLFPGRLLERSMQLSVPEGAKAAAPSSALTAPGGDGAIASPVGLNAT